MPGLTDTISEVLLDLVGGKATAGIRRVLVSSAIQRLGPGILRNFSANAMLAEFKALGFGVRRQWFLRQVRYFRTAEGIIERQALTPSHKKLLARDMPIALSSKGPIALTHEYSYQVEMSVMGFAPYDAPPGMGQETWRTQHYWFGSDKLMSPNEVVQAFEAKFKPTSMTKVQADWGSLAFVKASKRDPSMRL